MTSKQRGGQKGQTRERSEYLGLSFSEALNAYLASPSPPHIIHAVETASREIWRSLIREHLVAIKGLQLAQEMEEVLADVDDKFSRYFILDSLWSQLPAFRRSLFFSLEDATAAPAEQEEQA